jgi:hypothetical protein
MKWSVVAIVVAALAAVAGGGYYVLHQHEIRVELTGAQPPAERERAEAARTKEEIGTYKDAKHPSFPGSEKKE